MAGLHSWKTIQCSCVTTRSVPCIWWSLYIYKTSDRQKKICLSIFSTNLYRKVDTPPPIVVIFGIETRSGRKTDFVNLVFLVVLDRWWRGGCTLIPGLWSKAWWLGRPILWHEFLHQARAPAFQPQSLLKSTNNNISRNCSNWELQNKKWQINETRWKVLWIFFLIWIHAGDHATSPSANAIILNISGFLWKGYIRVMCRMDVLHTSIRL